MNKRKASDFFHIDHDDDINALDQDDRDNNWISSQLMKTRDIREVVPQFVDSSVVHSDRDGQLDRLVNVKTEIGLNPYHSVSFSRKDVVAAIDDENIENLHQIYSKPSSSSSTSSSTPSSSSSSIKSPHLLINHTKSAQNSESQPLYKLLKTGDEILALYSRDHQYYHAKIKAVMHKGFSSAKYDVEFTQYDNITETVSWRDVAVVNHQNSHSPDVAAIVIDDHHHSETKSNVKDPLDRSTGVMDQKKALTTDSRDVFGRDVVRRSENPSNLSNPVNNVVIIDGNIALALRKPLFMRLCQGSSKSASDGLKTMTDEDYVNVDMMNRLKGSWKQH